MERFEPINGFEGDYEISSSGVVRSMKHKKQRILKQSSRSKTVPYLSVSLSKNNVWKNFNVHRLVAETFLPNPNNYPQTNHKNAIKTDNRVENLEWVTRSQNVKHAYDLGLNENSGKPRKPVIATNIKTREEKYYESMSSAVADGFMVSRISVCCRGKSKTHLGHIWRLANV